MQTIALTALAMLAFAGNSILCRLALTPTDGVAIDPYSFTAIRLVAGAVTLVLLVVSSGGGLKRFTVAPIAAVSLFVYALAFSIAYVRLGAGLGALILFATVQFTMISAGLLRGERLTPVAAGGVALALAGTAYLVAPAVATPELSSSLMMAAAGVAWGVYSLQGQGATDPLAATASNFVATLPLMGVAYLIASPDAFASAWGVTLAAVSGAVTSGVGYAIWYRALPALRAHAAATVQLSVPVLAALGGVAFIAEPLTLRLALASVVILTGIYLVVRARAA